MGDPDTQIKSRTKPKSMEGNTTTVGVTKRWRHAGGSKYPRIHKNLPRTDSITGAEVTENQVRIMKESDKDGEKVNKIATTNQLRIGRGKTTIESQSKIEEWLRDEIIEELVKKCAIESVCKGIIQMCGDRTVEKVENEKGKEEKRFEMGPIKYEIDRLLRVRKGKNLGDKIRERIKIKTENDIRGLIVEVIRNIEKVKESEKGLEMIEIKYEIERLKRLERVESLKHKFRRPVTPVRTLEDIDMLEVNDCENEIEIAMVELYTMRKSKVKDREVVRQEIRKRKQIERKMRE